jgi:signal transduction histidine kinase
VTPQSQVLVAAVDQLAKEPENFVGDRRRTMYVAGVDVTLVERSDAQGDRVVLLLPEAIREWVRKLKIEGSLSLLTEHGRVVAGESSAEGSLKRVGAVTGLPWTLSLSTDLTPGMKELATRRRLLGAGLALIVLLLAGGSYLLWRLVRQELAVARLQTEFVAAVSHEFRTPLASLRHVTELLEEDDELPRGERSKFYAVLGRNTERLNRLVESLLDFSRMEGGRKPYVLRKVDARALTEQIVSAFRADVPEGFAVNLNMDDGDLTVNADAESLSHALWNVLDNAVKYSGDSRTVMVSVRKRGDGVVFSVEDQGLGIPQAERSEIFDRFVRGAKAHELGIKGTGLGLAMVAHIVEAHRGKVEVDSKEGEGSTFRVVLPVA